MSGAKKAIADVTEGSGDIVRGVASDPFKFARTVGKETERAVGGLGKNVERNAQTFANDLGTVLKGDFNNIGQSALRTFLNYKTFGLVNPDDMKKVTGETGSERAKSEAEKEARNEQANLAGYRQSEMDEMVKSVISGQVSSRRTNPGSRQTFVNFGSAPKSNTLLTVMRKQ